MRRNFNFHDLSWEEFESLVCQICMEVLGTGTIVFAMGPDGGRDAKFVGKAQRFPSSASPLNGNFIIQAKHTTNPVASCTQPEFSKIIRGETKKLEELIKNGELDHYIIFTNRKKPANKTIALEKGLKRLGLKDVHILGTEQINQYLISNPSIWKKLDFARYEAPLEISHEDLVELVAAFHKTLDTDSIISPPNRNFKYVRKKKKGQINKLSTEYLDSLERHSLPYFGLLQYFLSNPRNITYRELYDDTADEIRRRLVVSRIEYDSFDDVLTALADGVIQNNATLKRMKRFVPIFLHYMYYTCDIGQHDNSNQAA